MAKTIKELALEAYPIKMVKTYGILPGGDITEKDENLLERMAMEKGASAVLDEVVDFMNENKYISYNDVRVFIKQLKGE